MRSALRTLAGIAAAAAVALAIPLGSAQTPEPGPTPSPSPLSPTAASGHELYLRDCAWCHGERGEGTHLGPDLRGVGAASADFMLRTGRMPITDVTVQPERSDALYGRDEIEELVAYVATLGEGPEIPVVDPAAGDLSTGAELYSTHCAACHSGTGVGTALTSGLHVPGLRGLEPVLVAEAIRLGGAGLRSGNMPAFGRDTLDQHELDSVVRYVMFLQDPDNRGGVPLGYLGPVAEGFVAIAGALVLAVLLIRWIGEKA